MNISEKIREKRKKAGLTQEQLAGYLGVSAPAVYKWEKGTSCPDVALLPALARLLGMDMNELFSFREELTEREIVLFSQQLSETALQEGAEAAFALARQKIRDYPRCGQLLYMSACVLDAARILADPQKAAPPEWKEDIFRWYTQAAESSQEAVRYPALLMLAHRYAGEGNYEKAQAALEQIPSIPAPDKTLLEAEILRHQEDTGKAAELLERTILQALTRLQGYLYKLLELEYADGKTAQAERIAGAAAGMSRLFDLWPYNTIVPPLLIALYRKDAEESIRLLRRALEESQKPWHMGESPLYYRCAEGKHFSGLGSTFSQALLTEIRSGKKEYEFLQGNPELEKLLEEYP